MPEYIEVPSTHELFLEQPNEAQDRGLETPVLDSTVTIQMTISVAQFIQILSATNQGAEIIYPELVHELTDLLIQGAIDGE